MQRSVIITGAGGFLAGHCATAFDEAGWRTIGIGRSDPNRQAERLAAFYASDLGDAERIASLLEQHAPDALVHLAAPASVPQSLRHPCVGAGDSSRDLLGWSHLVETCYDCRR